MGGRVLVLIAFAIGVWIGVPRLPEARGTATAPERFAAERAMAHVRTWARAPRPSGSEAHARVVDALQSELAALGFAVERARAPGTPPLVNLVARPRGAPSGAPVVGDADSSAGAPPVEDAGAAPAPSPAPSAAAAAGVWLVAHSDTVPGSPGAADAGMGLAVLVEAARALSADGPPPGLHVLVTDGEERGLLGAEAHVARAADGAPHLVLNVEARGTEGPAYMFQTAGPPGALLGAWQASGCGAQASSLARAVYDMLPSDTDFTVFRRAGWWGYDFALIHGAWRYHTADDVPSNLDPRSVQQVGDCVVGLARAWLGLGEEGARAARSLAGLADGASADATSPVYAQAFGLTRVLPPLLVRVFGLATLAGLVFGLRESVRPRRAALAGGAAWMGALGLAWAGGMAALAFAARRPEFWERPVERVDPTGMWIGIGLVGVAAGWLALGLARRWEPAAPRGWHVVASGAAALVAVVLPTVGYVLLPGAQASAALVRGRPGLAAPMALLAGVLLGPLVHGLFPALTTRAAPVLAMAVVLLFAWLAPVDGPVGRAPGAAARPPPGGVQPR